MLVSKSSDIQNTLILFLISLKSLLILCDFTDFFDLLLILDYSVTQFQTPFIKKLHTLMGSFEILMF